MYSSLRPVLYGLLLRDPAAQRGHGDARELGQAKAALL